MYVPGSYEYNASESAGYCYHGYPVNNCSACAFDRETEAIRLDAQDEWTDTSHEDHAGHLDGLDA